MLIELKMCRFENAPWGFRLVGGADFDIPLTVVKVTEGSIAEQTGMRIGDIVVRINDDSTSGLTHNEAHAVLSQCGNVFFLALIREEAEIDEHENDKENYVPSCDSVEPPMSCTPDSMLASSMKSLTSEMSDKRFEASSELSSDGEREKIVENQQSECHDMSESSLKTEDDNIAALMSGEAEVLKDHNVIGVNFNRIFPKPGVCASSEVLRQLNEEAIKTKLEKEKERKKWTTFLQKPDRPIPKSKAQIEAEKQAATAYKVCIVKQPKRDDRSVTPIPPPKPEPVKEASPAPVEPEPEPEVEEEPPTDSEVPNLEDGLKESNDENSSSNQSTSTPETVVEEDFGQADENSEVSEEIEEEPQAQPDEEIVEKTEEELILEKQLVSVQQQLLALSSLPSTIQATLDAVTKQLAELLPNFKLQMPLNEVQPTIEVETSEDVIEFETEDADNDDDQVTTENEEDHKINEETEETTEETTPSDDNNNQESVKVAQCDHPTPIIAKNQEEIEEEHKLQEELTHKKQKEHGVIEELEQRIKRENLSKGPKRVFGPLTPQQRPQILPGGRRWYKPKDAYNDDFIAETLSAQAELIVGSTLGVNFMKYQKPEKKIDLEKSEVYKVVHHLDKDPIRGIEIRPPVVPAEEDIRNRATPISCS